MNMTSSILLNQDGTVNGISTFNTEYPYECPSFITFENFTRMKCINMSDHFNPESWVEIKTIDDNNQ